MNVLAHELLLRACESRLAEGGRVVVTSSGVHEPDHPLARGAGIPVPRWNGVRALLRPEEAADADRIVDGRQRYSTSKLGNVLQARALQRRLRAAGRHVDVFAIDPGLMVDTDLARDLPRAARWVLRAVGTLATPFVDNMRLSGKSAANVATLFEEPEWTG